MKFAEFDFHVHSMYSFDSVLKPEKIIKVAKHKGLKGVAITDHNTIRGGISVRKYHEHDFITIIGAEINTELGDITGLFLNEEIKSKMVANVIDEIRSQDGLVILPHPFRGHDINMFKDLLNKIDAIEGYNSRTNATKNNMAQEFIETYKFPVIAGSDAHFSGEIGLARTIIKNVSSEEDIRKSILNYETRIKGRRSPLYFRVASTMLTGIKNGNPTKLPHNLIMTSIKKLKKRIHKFQQK